MNIDHDARVFSISVTQLARLMCVTSLSSNGDGIDGVSPRSGVNRDVLNEETLGTDNNGLDRLENIHKVARAWLGIKKHHQLMSDFQAAALFDAADDLHQEVQFTHEREINGWQVRVTGRIDLVSKNPTTNKWKVIEFKTVVGSLQVSRGFLHEQYRMQVLLYALFLSLIHGLKPRQVEAMLVYHDLLNNTYQCETVPFTARLKARLLDEAMRVMERIIKFESEQAQYWKDRASILPWPHRSTRVLQSRMRRDLQFAFMHDDKRYLLLLAPTGSGKTAAAVHGMLTIAFSKKRRLLILTAKKTQREEYKKVLSMINQKLMHSGLKPIPFIDLQFTMEECTCSSDQLPFEAVVSPQKRAFWITRVLERGSIDFTDTNEFPCKYHAQFIVIVACRVILGDYNHLISRDLSAMLEATSIPRIKGKSPFFLLIDEIHNLPTRMEAMLEASLSTKDLKNLLRELEVAPRVKNKISPSIRKMIHVITSQSGRHDPNLAKSVLHSVQQWQFTIFHALQDARLMTDASLVMKPLNEMIEKIRDIERILVVAAENIHVEITREENQGTSSTDFCMQVSILHPSDLLRKTWSRFMHVLGMSATIEPLDFYRELLGFPAEDTLTCRYASPFPRDSCLIIVVPTVDTRFTYRHEQARFVAEEIINIYLSHPARYLVVYPSFQFLELIERHLSLYIHDVSILSQKPSMTKSERISFLERVTKTPKVIIQAVSGGIFTEGLNLPSLQGIIIVSPHVLPSTPRRRHLVQHLISKGLDPKVAYRRVYILPAMSKMIQAAGRLLRHLEDRGIIIFLGKRFASRTMQSLFPPHLKPNIITNDPNPLIRNFWRRKTK